jgi:hypothetical protein
VGRSKTFTVTLNSDPEKLQRDADYRFTKVHQLNYESVSMFYDRYLQECNAWLEAGNTFVESEIVIEGDDTGYVIDETNVKVIAARARILVKQEKKKAMNFLTKLDRNRFTSMLDELANDLSKGKNNYPNNIVDAMQLAQTYRSEGRVIGEMTSSTREVSETAYVTSGYKSGYNKNNYNNKRKIPDIDGEGENKGSTKEVTGDCFLCNKPGHWKNQCPLLKEAVKYIEKNKKK